MKLISILILLSFFPTSNIKAQTDCKVLKPEISLSYTGDCKKGLAHGKGEAIGIDHYEGDFKNGFPYGHGIYTWTTGEVYEGAWVNGLRHGKGKYTFFVNGKDTIQEGKWVKDVFKGTEHEKEYSVSVRRNLDRYSFFHRGYGNTIIIKLYKLGIVNSDIENLMLSGNSGFQINQSTMIGFEQVIFPFEGKIKYRTWNKLHTTQYDVVFEFKINRPGSWNIIIHN